MSLLLLLAACSVEFPTPKDPLFDSGFATVRLLAIDPDAAALDGGEPLCVRGEGLVEDDIAEVTVDGRPCETATSFDDQTLGCVLPAADAPGEVSLSVLKTDGSSDSLPFTYVELSEPVRPVTCCGMAPRVGQTVDPGAIDQGSEVRIYVAGLTEEPGAAPLKVQAGIGSRDSRPDQGCWAWWDATFFAQAGAEEHWRGQLLAPDRPATYHYAYRVSADNGRTWAWCDQLAADAACAASGGGSNDGYQPSQAGILYVQ